MGNRAKSGWLLYCMVHIPFFWKFKVGITSLRIGATKRAKAIDKAVFGFPWPIMAVPIMFGAYRVEQEMHRIMRPFQTRFYRGDGHSEWFNVAPLFFAVPVMLVIWGVYLFLADCLLGTRLLPFFSEYFFEAVLVLIASVLDLLQKLF